MLNGACVMCVCAVRKRRELKLRSSLWRSYEESRRLLFSMQIMNPVIEEMNKTTSEGREVDDDRSEICRKNVSIL